MRSGQNVTFNVQVTRQIPFDMWPYVSSSQGPFSGSSTELPKLETGTITVSCFGNTLKSQNPHLHHWKPKNNSPVLLTVAPSISILICGWPGCSLRNTKGVVDNYIFVPKILQNAQSKLQLIFFSFSFVLFGFVCLSVCFLFVCLLLLLFLFCLGGGGEGGKGFPKHLSNCGPPPNVIGFLAKIAIKRPNASEGLSQPIVSSFSISKGEILQRLLT